MSEPTLHIVIVRNLPDYNPGKAAAQAAHAQAMFSAAMNRFHEYTKYITTDFYSTEIFNEAHAKACASRLKNSNIYATNKPIGSTFADFAAWNGDSCFGRTLVRHQPPYYEGNLEDILYHSTLAGRVFDPSYPWRTYFKDLCVSGELTAYWAFESDTTLIWEGIRDIPLY